MPRKKPTAVFVIGILNVVFGAMRAVCNLCTGVALGGGYVLVRKLYNDAPPEAKKPLEDVGNSFLDNVPYLVPFLITSLVVSTLLGIMQIVSGIGLIKVKNWARWLCVVWAVLMIVVVAVNLFYQMAVLSPGMEKAMDDIEKVLDRIEQDQRKKG